MKKKGQGIYREDSLVRGQMWSDHVISYDRGPQITHDHRTDWVTSKSSPFKTWRIIISQDSLTQTNQLGQFRNDQTEPFENSTQNAHILSVYHEGSFGHWAQYRQVWGPTAFQGRYALTQDPAISSPLFYEAAWPPLKPSALNMKCIPLFPYVGVSIRR